MFGGWFGKAKDYDETGSTTIVYMRDLIRSRPARHWESPVHYDAWGAPFAYDYQFGQRAVNLNENGRFGHYDWQEWKHKSGPPVKFALKGDPSKHWFPKNPNDDLPL